MQIQVTSEGIWYLANMAIHATKLEGLPTELLFDGLELFKLNDVDLTACIQILCEFTATRCVPSQLICASRQEEEWLWAPGDMASDLYRLSCLDI